MLLSPVLLVLMVYLFAVYVVDFSKLPAEARMVLPVLLVGFCVMDFYFCWRIWKPALVVRQADLTINSFGLLRNVVLDWDQIEGMTEEKVPTIGSQSVTRYKIVYKKGHQKRRELIVAPYIWRKGDEAASRLREMLPVGFSVQGGHKLDQLKAVPLNHFRYKGMELDEQGISVVSPATRERKVILWERITGLQAEGAFDGSRGTVVLYIDFASGASTKRLTLRGVESYEFIEFIKLLMGRVTRQAIDPGLFKLLEEPAGAMKIDTGAALLIISGFILAIAGMVVLSFYPPTIGSTWTYPLLLIPLCLLPLIYALKLLMDKGADSEQKKFKSRVAAFGFNLGAVAAAAILFILSPASFDWLMADANAIAGRMETAETYYRRAEKDLSENADFLFAVGQYYYRKHSWELAAGYYIRAYEKDPANWMAEPLLKIPDALHRAGQSDEALAWCDKIAGSYANRKAVVRAIQRKRAEIEKHADD